MFSMSMYDSLDPLYLTEEEIESITNARDGFEKLLDRNLLLNYVNNLDDIKELLRLKYHPKTESNEVIEYTNLYEKYPEIMKKLSCLLVNLKEYIELPTFKREIGEIFKISESQIGVKLEELKKMIERDKFPILTAGEAKAGKSTFINLLLGTNLLPVDVVTCTRIICEIKNSSEKKTVTFVGNKEEIAKGNVIDLSEYKEKEKEIASIIKQETHKEYTKAIYEYPVSFLENYTYLVDSPGIGDTCALEKMTFDYLSNCAPAFIFVLNATNSNGLTLKAKELIEKARSDLTNDTKKYLTDLTNPNLVKEYFFQYHKAIFILNHWDTVKENAKSNEEVEEVRKIIISEIQLLWHHSAAENKQIFFISARQANEWQHEGIVRTEITNIRQCIKQLVVNLYQKNIENSLELFNIILHNMEKKILEKINTTVDNKYCRLYDKKHAEKLCRKLEDLIKEMDNRKYKIKEQLKPKFKTMAILLTKHLKSKTVENRILEVSHSQISPNDNMDLLNIVFKKILETKLYEEIKLWEEKNNEMENLYSFLNNLFEENLIEISDEIKMTNSLINKESLLKAWQMTNQENMPNIDKDFISKIEKVFIISTITLLFPVVALAGLLATPLIMSHMINEKKSNDEKLKEYKKNPQEYLRDLISKNLQKLTADEVEKNFFNNVQRKCEDHIKGFENFLTVEINEKKQLIMDIENEYREIPEILSSLSGLFHRVEACFGEYHNLRNACDCAKDRGLIVRASTYEELLNSEKRVSESLATGKHSCIFKNNNHPSLVFKTYNKTFMRENARFQMQEIDFLIKGSEDYILKCKRICILEKEQKLLVVLDNVDCNLHKYLKENMNLVPGKQEKNTKLWEKACKFILNISLRISEGLECLHNNFPRMVHPDLRLDTILVKKLTNPDKIKVFICDACTNLPTQRCHKKSGKDNDTPENSFDMGGYTKENIFRLGKIFYKLAQFEEEIESKPSTICLTNLFNESDSLESLESDPDIDWDNEKHSNIPEEYNNLIKDCVSLKPENRPTIGEIIKSLKKIKI